MGHPFLDRSTPLALAHRGGSLEAPENSWAALVHAVDELGYTYLETDLHATSDGRLALIHDATLDRTTDQRGPVAERSAAELAGVEIKGPNGERSRGVPLLDEVLDRWPHLNVNIDVKADSVVAPLVELLRGDSVLKRICAGSFNDARMKRLRELIGPELCTVCGVAETVRLRLASFGLPLAAHPLGACLEVPLSQKVAGPVKLPVVDRRLVELAHRRGLAVIVWTVDDVGEMRRLLDLGVDGLITDRPTVLKDLLVRLGRWPSS